MFLKSKRVWVFNRKNLFLYLECHNAIQRKIDRYRFINSSHLCIKNSKITIYLFLNQVISCSYLNSKKLPKKIVSCWVRVIIFLLESFSFSISTLFLANTSSMFTENNKNLLEIQISIVSMTHFQLKTIFLLNVQFKFVFFSIPNLNLVIACLLDIIVCRWKTLSN